MDSSAPDRRNEQTAPRCATPTQTVGIPRGLLCFHYLPLWSTYFSRLGLRVRVSEPTDRSLLETAQSVTGSDLCLPVKVFLAHVERLKDEVDWLFLPRVMSVSPDAYMCPKVLGLTDMVRNVFPRLPGLLDPLINAKLPKPLGFVQALEKVGRPFSESTEQLRAAWQEAESAQAEFDRDLLIRPFEAVFQSWSTETLRQEHEKPRDQRYRVAVIGRRYLIFDAALSHNLFGLLARQGVSIVTPDHVPSELLSDLYGRLPKKVYWQFGKNLVAAGMFYAERSGVDGIINVSSFGCGQDSFTTKLVEHHVGKATDKPFLNLVLDEHSAHAGVNTRLEAFLDMLEGRKKAGRVGPRPKRKEGPSPSLPLQTTQLTAEEQSADNMHLTIPHMGHLHIGFENVFRNLGVHITMPPRPNKEAIWLGARYSPECACLPFKLNLGNMIQALQQGATDIIMPGGFGPCRFGYYGAMQEQILRDLGFQFRMGSADDPDSLHDMLATIRKIAGLRSKWDSYRVFLFILYRIALVDRAVAHSLRLRPRETEKRAADRALKQSIELINATRRFVDLIPARLRVDRLFAAVPIDRKKPVVRIGLVGEIFMVLENHANMNIEERLGEMGVEIDRGLWLSDWLNDRFRFMPFRRNTFQWALKQSAPYLQNPCGGESVNSVGHTLHFARKGLDGVIHLMPFTCMPELVAQTILDRISTDYNLPILTLAFDEHTSSGAVQTRLEAFVDLIKRK